MSMHTPPICTIGTPMNEHKDHKLEKNIFYTGLVSFFTDMTSRMAYAVLPLFLMSLGATKTELSLIEGIAESTASVLKALSGFWSDRLRKNKPFMLLGYAFTAVLTPLFTFTNSALQVLLLRFTERVGKGLRTAPRDALVAASGKHSERGRNFGFHKAMDSMGSMLGPLIAALILYFFPRNYRLVFAFSAIPALIGIYALVRFVKEAHQPERSAPVRFRLRDLPGRFYGLLGILFVFTLGNSTDALLLVKAQESGISESLIPVVYFVYYASSVLSAVPAGRRSDHRGRERVILAGYLLYALVYLGFSQVKTAGPIWVLFILYGFYLAMTDGVQKALVTDLVPKDRQATALGIYAAVIGITLLPASLIAGVLYDTKGSSTPFLFGSAMALLAAGLMYIFYKTKVKEKS